MQSLSLAHSEPLLNEPGQLPPPHLLVPSKLGKDQPIAGPDRGFEDLERKRFCCLLPEDWQGLAPGFLSTLFESKKTVFSSCQNPMVSWWAPWWASGGPAPTLCLLLMPSQKKAAAGSLPRPQDAAFLGRVHLPLLEPGLPGRNAPCPTPGPGLRQGPDADRHQLGRGGGSRCHRKLIYFPAKSLLSPSGCFSPSSAIRRNGSM